MWCCLEDNYQPEHDEPPHCDNPNFRWTKSEVACSRNYTVEWELKDAAEKHAAYACSRDPELYSSFICEGKTVLVKDDRDDKIHPMVVRGEQRVEFTASPW
jgi:hypothetical protein